MTTLKKSWLATLVRRWHSNPDLCHTVDPIGGHSTRVAIIIKHCWPDASPDLILRAIYHDLAESITGDIPPAAKAMFPTFAMMEQHISVANGWHIPLIDTDETRFKFADKLDAWMYADHYNAAHGPEWDASLAQLQYAADRMGIADKLKGDVW